MAYFAPESPAGLPRNRWPLSIGISGRFGPEYAASLFLLVTVFFSVSFKFQSEPFSKVNQTIGNRPRALLLLNNPFFPSVRALPEVESGKAVLKVRNYSHETIVVENLFVSDEGESFSKPLLEAPLKLRPADTEWIDVTSILGSLFQDQVTEKRTKVVQIEIRLASQGDPLVPCKYIVAHDGRSVLQFSFEEDGAQAQNSQIDPFCSQR